ncbi:MAG: hypothetical protein WCF04_07725 [Candidatus Nanopelagicales bacterium]
MKSGCGTALAATALVLAGCATSSEPGQGGSATPSSSSTASPSGTQAAGANGSLYYYPQPGTRADRYPIDTDGTIGAPVAVPWKTGADAEATVLADGVGPWALTRIVELPFSDVAATRSLQVLRVETGEVAHEIKVPGWCSGPDGASYPCLLLDETRMVRTTPIDGERDGTITISSTVTGDTIAEYGPFPVLAGVLPTTSPDYIIFLTYDRTARQHTILRLDTRTGDTTEIGTLPVQQPPICVLGTDSVLSYDSKLKVVGPAAVAAVEVPELANDGPGAVGCSANGSHVYVRTSTAFDPEKELGIDAVAVADGSRKSAVTLESSQAYLQMTR